MNARELRINGRVDLAALQFNPGAPRRALALHGWLDNAMSFASLAAHWPECEITALEFAGHGRSGHLPEGSWYHFIDYCDDVLAALDHLAVPIDLLLAHSLGGAVATALAAALPERVPRLALIEALGPLSTPPERWLPSLRQGLLDRRRLGDKRLRVFERRDQAIAARLQANPMLPTSAAALIERGLRPAGAGWVWSSDPRLTLHTPVRVPEAVVGAWIAGIEADTLVFLAAETPDFFPAELQASRLAGLRRGQLIRLPGHHHLHMDNPAPIAECLAEFVAGAAGGHHSNVKNL